MAKGYWNRKCIHADAFSAVMRRAWTQEHQECTISKNTLKRQVLRRITLTPGHRRFQKALGLQPQKSSKIALVFWTIRFWLHLFKNGALYHSLHLSSFIFRKQKRACMQFMQRACMQYLVYQTEIVWHEWINVFISNFLKDSGFWTIRGLNDCFERFGTFPETFTQEFKNIHQICSRAKMSSCVVFRNIYLKYPICNR